MSLEGFGGIWFWAVSIPCAVAWIAALVTFFRTPSVAWASEVERYLMLGGLIFWGLMGAAVWFFGVRPILRERLAEMRPESAPTEAWRLKHLT